MIHPKGFATYGESELRTAQFLPSRVFQDAKGVQGEWDREIKKNAAGRQRFGISGGGGYRTDELTSERNSLIFASIRRRRTPSSTPVPLYPEPFNITIRLWGTRWRADKGYGEGHIFGSEHSPVRL